MLKSKSGKQAVLYNAVKGSLIEGDGVTALADNSWFKIEAVASSGSQLPIGEVGGIFKSPDSGNAITPASGDDVYPLTLTQICKADASYSNSKGTIDVTDDCGNGYNSYIPDGFTDISGDVSAFLKFEETDGSIAAAQKSYLGKFFDLVDDDGAGTYTVTQKDDDDILLMLLMDKAITAETMIQAWMIVPAILSSLTTNKPLKGVQNFDFSWQKGEGPASVYQRTLNSEEV